MVPADYRHADKDFGDDDRADHERSVPPDKCLEPVSK
jgi:hypothetical protein